VLLFTSELLACSDINLKWLLFFYASCSCNSPVADQLASLGSATAQGMPLCLSQLRQVLETLFTEKIIQKSRRVQKREQTDTGVSEGSDPLPKIQYTSVVKSH